MEKLINVIPIREASLNAFCMAFRWYNEIYSRQIELSDDDLNRIFERIHAKAMEVYEHKIWGTLETDGNKFWYSENPDTKPAFPLVPVLVNYGKALLTDRFPELGYPNEPQKAAVEIFILVFIYAYSNSMKSPEKKLTLLPPELLPSAIDPIIDHLLLHGKNVHNFNGLSVNLIINIFDLNNSMNQADKLEGIYNKNALNKIWNIRKRKNDNIMVGIIMLDADQFKQVNDNCGHNVGDEVLEIYRDSILKAITLINVKNKTFPARWGGDEFCVCVFDSNEQEMINLSKKINSELKNHEKWIGIKEKKYKEHIDFPRTFSQGIALGKQSDFTYLNALEKKADEQAYKAKENGRNCIYYMDKKIIID